MNFYPRLHHQTSVHRSAAYAEARAGFVLERIGFQICEWEPLATGKKPGDLSVKLGETPAIFVEVKAPSWQGELSEQLATASAEQKAAIFARMNEDKYQNGDGRWIDPAGAVLRVIAKNAVPKLADDRPNLIVVFDNLFVTAVGNPLLNFKFREAFKALPGLDRVGAVFLVQPEFYGLELLYRCDLAVNGLSLPACRLPEPALDVLRGAVEQSTLVFAQQMATLRGQLTSRSQ